MRKVNPFQELSHKIHFNDHHKNVQLHQHSTNAIQTGKYTLLTFVPKSLYIQFLRIANVYFLIIAVLSSIGEISSLSPFTSVAPLIIVLGTSMIREALEDWGRHKNDRITNNQETLKYKKKNSHHCHHQQDDKPEEFHFISTYWKDLQVGDIVKIENDHQIPADIVVLSSSDENGLAYVETANLDGEKNLKLKQAKPEVKNLIQTTPIEELQGAMLVDRPNSKIQSFKGVMEIDTLPTLYLNYSNIILRGTHLKNVDYVIGIVVYTGHETKLMQNQGLPRNKKSHIEKQLNKYIFGVFIVQCILCVLLAILSTLFMENYDTTKGSNLNYIFPDTIQNSTSDDDGTYPPFIQGLFSFGSFMLLLNTMIPISLIVSLELTKFFQALGISLDDLLVEAGQRAKVLNMLIHEDLAKIDYIFADKTGTLTTNEMKFISCSIHGDIYYRQHLTRVICLDSTNSTPEQKQSDLSYHLFWLNLSLCHDVVIDKKLDCNNKTQLHYQGSSPDEVELVTAASEADYVFSDKKGEITSLYVNGKHLQFLLLNKIDFSSDRKRMSVVMRDLDSNKLYLFSKGADSMILKRIRRDTPFDLLDKTQEDLKKFSKEGLRTLAIGYKELDDEEFLDWQIRYTQAQQDEFNLTCDINSQSKLLELEEELEKDLILLGATALEDRLQDGVAETITDLHKADIKVWMLTGDKLETAENIGYSTNLLAQDTKVFKVGTSNEEETLLKYLNIKNKIAAIKEHGNVPFSVGEDVHQAALGTSRFNTFALIIDGDAINFTFHNEKLKTLFLEMIPEFRAVICCRSTPNQKADVVTFVKDNLKKMTLAIGDGGNDVNMIQRAHIGVGIFGKEGNQAAFASDYAIAKFSFLWRLLFVHGRWACLRTSNFINFFFYKNLIFTLPQFWFALNSGYSGQSIYDNTYITNYNTVFTAVAPVYYASLEQDINPRENQTIRKAMPYVYEESRKMDLFSLKRFLFWWATGIFHSVIIYYLTLESSRDIMNDDGMTSDLWSSSVQTLTGVFFTVFGVIFIGTNHFNIITFICYIPCTLLAFFPIGNIVLDQFKTPMQYVLSDIITCPKVWPALLLATITCVFTFYIPKKYFIHFRPTLVDLLMQDRRKRWSRKVCKMYGDVSKENPSSPSKRFNFDASIVIADWCEFKLDSEAFKSSSEYAPVAASDTK